MSQRHIIFLVNLLQDVNILRPLILMAGREVSCSTHLLVTEAFRKRDKTGIWQRELGEIVTEAGASISFYEHEFDALRLLSGKGGVMFAASESHLGAHKQVHDVFRLAPSSFVRVTLQHGFECVGFLQSKDQNMAHGKSITFAADIICGWCDPARLTSVVPSQRPKLYVTGPTAIIQSGPKGGAKAPLGMGLVCENMHSPRLNVAGDFKSDFLSMFGGFCEALQKRGEKVTLRPHPGGQYVIKNKVELAPNVELNNSPIYKVDLSRYAYGISAPSSILIDMVLAGIPTAVWQDETGVMDLGNYEGLTRISKLDEWLEFSREATVNPRRFLERQREFLEKQKMLTQPEVVAARYANLMRLSPNPELPQPGHVRPEIRIQLVANGYTPTLQLSFIKPLTRLVNEGKVVVDVITETQMNRLFSKRDIGGENAREWIKKRFDAFEPSAVVFSRYGGRHAEWMLEYLKNNGTPTIYHIDDDLLNIPAEIGEKKHEFHNDPLRLASIRYFLDHADLVYCSTQRLKERFGELAVRAPLTAGKIYCSASVMRPAINRPVKKIGYMGIGHEQDLLLILPVLITYLRNNPDVEFELFGSIPFQEQLKEFGSRVRLVPKVENYEQFLQRLTELEWDIGICPLASIPFNMLKANTKWVEYTAVGTAVIASKGTVYDECCADGCGILADSEESWLAALERLTKDPEERFRQVQRAQQKLEKEYSTERLRDQMMAILNKAGQEAMLSERDDAAENAQWRAGRVKERILYISNDYVPTLQLSFIKPLAPHVSSGRIEQDLLTETQLKQRLWESDGFGSAQDWIRQRILDYRPTLVVFCRYSGPHADLMIETIRELGVTTIYHIDDDLLDVPNDIGESKAKLHNSPRRLNTVRYLLDDVDLVYCSTEKLKKHLENSKAARAPIVAGEIYCPGEVIVPAQGRPVRKVGYMASADHAHNLSLVIGAIKRYLRENPEIEFEFFGSIPIPEELGEFKDRVKSAPKIDDYEKFLQRFSEYGWDIGICPLTPIHFNQMKANTKWVEYTSIGAAVVASKGTVYDECCADGCGILAETEDEWLDALNRLTHDPQARFDQVRRAQEKLVNTYSTERLRKQVLDIISQSHRMHEQRAHKELMQ